MKRARTHLLKTVLMGMAAGFIWSCSAKAWWNHDWTIRKKITIDTGSTGSNAPAHDFSGQGNDSQGPVTTTSSLIGPGLRLGGKVPVTIPPTSSLAWTEGTKLKITQVALATKPLKGL